MMGDFNLPCVDWSTNTLKRGNCTSTPDKAAVDALFDFMDDLFLSQHVLEPTRHHKSTLDLILTNHSCTIHNISVEKTLLSDHDLVHCTLNFQHPRTRPSSPTPTTAHPYDNLDFHKANWGEITRALSLIDWSFILTSDIIAAWRMFEDIVTNTCTKNFKSTN